MYLARIGATQSRMIKTICLLLFVAIVLLIGVTPASAESADRAGDCQSAGQKQAPVPPCCVTPACPLYHSITANVPPVPNQPALSKVIHLVRLPTSLLPDSWFDLKRPPPRHTLQRIPHPPGDDYRCRDSLNSEEPPQI